MKENVREKIHSYSTPKANIQIYYANFITLKGSCGNGMTLEN